MPTTKTVRVGKRGTLVLPAPLRKRFGLEEDTLVIVETRDEGLLLRPAVAVPVDVRPGDGRPSEEDA